MPKRPQKQFVPEQNLEWSFCVHRWTGERTLCLLPVCVTFKPLLICFLPSGLIVHLQPQSSTKNLSCSPLEWTLISSANCIWKTMPLLGENLFVFPPTIDTVDNGKSRMPFYSFAFFTLHVDSLHFVTVVNIDIISIPLCRRMRGMWTDPLVLKIRIVGQRWEEWCGQYKENTIIM